MFKTLELDFLSLALDMDAQKMYYAAFLAPAQIFKFLICRLAKML